MVEVKYCLGEHVYLRFQNFGLVSGLSEEHTEWRRNKRYKNIINY
jgi:hypothetical protein